MAEEKKYMTINMGPQHPATHGVLRILLELDGEIIVKATPFIGYLHRGVEKLAEARTYQQALTLTDRLDYTNGLANNLAYCLAAERLCGIEAPKRAQYLRVILAELQRIAGHLIWIGTHALDIGAMTLLFYAFRERETILSIVEHVTGARLTPSFIRVGGLAKEMPPEFEGMVRAFVKEFPRRVDEYETLLTENVIWRRRTKNVARLSKEDAISFGVTGPVLRASGVYYDVRKAYPYSSYEDFDFEVPMGENGDVFDRYDVRVREMRQSNRIIEQAVNRLPDGPINAVAPQYVPPEKDDVERDMAALIRHFKLMEEGFRPPVGEAYGAVESPKGELGFYLVSDGTNKPYRFRIRPPSFLNLAAVPKMIEGQMVADVIAAIGSVDIVLGEIDR
jgi:NADH-quinone oxidoreductase subunit D